MNFSSQFWIFCNSEKKERNVKYQLTTVSKKAELWAKKSQLLYFLFHGWNKEELWHVNSGLWEESQKYKIPELRDVNSEFWEKKSELQM